MKIYSKQYYSLGQRLHKSFRGMIQERDYQLPLFKDDIEVKNDRINDMQKLSIWIEMNYVWNEDTYGKKVWTYH